MPGIPLRNNWGRLIRDGIARTSTIAGPLVKRFLPNFIAVHYFYIITISIIGSVILYPYKNIKYIDALFFSACAATQAGMNTVDVNEMKLYQQLAIYFITMITTPIFIHSGVLFVRLYWFERRFDNIKHTSKLNFNMRRTATLARRDTLAASAARGPPLSKSLLETSERHTSPSPGTPTPGETPPGDAIRFAQLPHPRHKTAARREPVEPSDMFMSISMMHQSKADVEEDAGPALRISGPAERERPPPQRSTPRRSFSIGRSRTSSRSRPAWFRRSQSPPIDSDQSIDSEDEDEEVRRTLSRTQTRSLTRERSEAGSSNPRAGRVRPHLRRAFSSASNTLAKTTTFDRFRRRLRSSADSVAVSSESDSLESESESSDSDVSAAVPPVYLSWHPTIGRNSTFVALSDAQKEELGGVEYRAIKLLCKLLVVYYVGFHVIAGVMFVGWACTHDSIILLLREQGVGAAWWAFFTSALSFNDLGITLTYDSMLSFSTDAYILLVSGFFIIIGNTGFPILLRFLIWVQFRLLSELLLYRESLGFLLDHPRRCFTMLFSLVPTWWLLFILATLNILDVVLFVVLDIHAELLAGLSPGTRVLQGLYQAFATRTAGFSVLDVLALHPSVQISYMLMMYISVLPVAISIRRTNVYEEQSLGVYQAGNDASTIEETPKSFVSAHLRRQLSFDLWFIFLGLFIICIAEGNRIQSGDPRFTVFAVLFEIVSAYGTVGLSLGYPTVNTSLCGEFSVVSKLVIIAMMIRGRHRGLPYALDRAIMLPSEGMLKHDDEGATHPVRRPSNFRLEALPFSFSLNPGPKPRRTPNRLDLSGPPGRAFSMLAVGPHKRNPAPHAESPPFTPVSRFFQDPETELDGSAEVPLTRLASDPLASPGSLTEPPPPGRSGLDVLPTAPPFEPVSRMAPNADVSFEIPLRRLRRTDSSG